MKAILEFNLPEEASEHLAAQNGIQWKIVAWEADNWLRNSLKYGHDFKTVDEALGCARAGLHKAIDARGLSLDD